MDFSNQLDHISSLVDDEFLTRNGQFDSINALYQVYSKAFASGRVESYHLSHLITELVKFQTVRSREVVNQKKETKPQNSENLFACILCNSLFFEPVTLGCGHTFCKGCFEEECQRDFNTICKKCNCHCNANFRSVNILLSSLIQKWFPMHHNFISKIAQGKKFMESGKSREAIDLFSNILQDFPQNINALCWRSDSFFRVGLLDRALKDIEVANQLQPRLTRVIQRKAKILSMMGHVGESAVAFLQCLVIEPTNKKCREELQKVLSQLFSPEVNEDILRNCLQIKENMSSNAVYKTERGNDRRHENVSVYPPVDEKSIPGKSMFYKNDSEVSSCENWVFGQHNERRKAMVNFIPEKEDFECKLCLDLLLRPVTTPCGHTFCIDCLKRALDHRSDCPCCRSSMANFLEEKQPAVDEILELIAKNYFSSEYTQKKLQFAREISSVCRAGTDIAFEIPIFVCTMAFPGIPCPLHIYEPRYRLMIRRCMESDSRCFGMCIPEEGKEFADVGTILEIKEINMMPDGRSIIKTVGSERFRVLERGMKDGYCTAKIKWLKDEKEEDPAELEELRQLNETCYCLAQLWFKQLSDEQQSCVVSAVGPLPELEEDLQGSTQGPSWIWWVLSALPLEYKPKQIILAMTTIEERLKGLRRFLVMLIKMQQKLGKE